MWKNRVVWCVLVLAALGFYLFENGTGTRALLAALVVLPAVSALLLYLPRVRVAAEIDLPETARRGEGVGGVLRLRGGGNILPVRLSGTLAARNLLTGEESAFPVSAVVRAGKAAELPFSVAAAHSGALAVSLRSVKAADPLGLFARRLPTAAEGTALVPPVVRPVTVELAETADLLADTRNYSARRPGYDPGETFRIREYAPGDPPCSIHWKLSQKTDAVLVRDYGLPVADRALLLLETASLSPEAAVTPEDIDPLLDLLFSVSAALLAMEIAHTAGWRDARTGRFASLEIAAPEDQAALRRALLENPLAAGEESVAGAYAREGGIRAFAHAALLSTYVPPDAGLLCRGNRVTALLTGARAVSDAPREGVETVAFTADDLCEGNLRLVL